ncbi:a disintegrin and metalloproteinase with thrombospondin motifs 18, partial [Caerostris extrusa]
NVGCDGKIESSVTPDICGVCNGDNSTCKTIEGTFKVFNLTTGYHEVIKIPPNSRHINISEISEYSTYLALQDGKGKYYLNENWVLDWPGRYAAAGTVFSYRRWPGQPESLVAKGPTNQELTVEVLIKGNVESEINYEFIISAHQVQWKMQNSTCSVTCGNGTFISSPVCKVITGEVGEDMLCDAAAKPYTKSYVCNEIPCGLKWHIGEWSQCNSDKCEEMQQRNVFCMVEDKKVSDSKCAALIRPIETRTCPHNKCLYTWHIGTWSKIVIRRFKKLACTILVAGSRHFFQLTKVAFDLENLIPYNSTIYLKSNITYFMNSSVGTCKSKAKLGSVTCRRAVRMDLRKAQNKDT